MADALPAAPPNGGSGASARASLGKALGVGSRFSGLLIAIVVVWVLFTFLSPPGTFSTMSNVLGLARSMSTLAIVALGVTLVIVVGEIDLSFGYLYGLTGMLVAVAWIVWGWPVWLAIILAVVVAGAVGAFNTFFTTILGIPSFIVTLGSGTIVYSLTLLTSNSRTYQPAFPPPGSEVPPDQLAAFSGLANQNLPFGVPMQGIWMVAAAILFWFLLDKSLFGFRLKAIGGNLQAAHIAKLPVVRYKLLAFMAASIMACVAAILDFSFIGAVSPTGGQSLLFPVFAAVIIGGASLAGGRGSVAGTLSGGALLAILANGFAILAAGPFFQQAFLGVVTIAAVVLDRRTHKKR